ncbi:MAG: hypothetical protein ACM3JD_00755 [Rudaea sp.]
MNIRPTQFDGLQALEITTAQVKLVAVTQVGPRIAFLGKPDGDNLLYWQRDDKGYGEWRLLGGHRTWVTRPDADEAEDAYIPDNAPCQVETGGSTVTLTGSADPTFKIQRGIRIEAVDDSTFKVTGFVKNNGPMLYSGGVWSITCSNPAGGKEYGIPLFDPNGSWELCEIAIPRKWAGHTARVNDPQIELNEEFMIVRPQGVESKRALSARPGIIALTWSEKKLSFVKRAPFDPSGIYPMGCNLAFYIGPGNFMLEMETMGPQRGLLPGESIESTETWKLLDDVLDWKDVKRVTGLFQ